MFFQQIFRKGSTNVQLAFRRDSGTKDILIENQKTHNDPSEVNGTKKCQFLWRCLLNVIKA